MIIEFFVSGNPVPKQSYRHSKRGGYQPERVTDWQEYVGWQAKLYHRGKPTRKRYSVSLIFYFPKYRRGRRPDVGNLEKPVLDAMNKIVYEDDEQVDELYLRKYFNSDNPGVMIAVKEIYE